MRRVGDPQLTARLHITFGRLEGRAGHFDRALRHFELGHTCWLSRRISGFRLLLTLVSRAFSLYWAMSSEAVECATAGGSAAQAERMVSRQARGGLQFGVPQSRPGRHRATERQLKVAADEDTVGNSYGLVLLDTRAQLAMKRGHLREAEELLTSEETLPPAATPWYALSVSYTLVRALLLQNKISAAKEVALEGESRARKARYELIRGGFSSFHRGGGCCLILASLRSLRCLRVRTERRDRLRHAAPCP